MIRNSKIILYNRIFLFVCLTGCVIQLADIFRNYIQHSVVSKVILSYPASITVPDLTVCSEYIDVINYTAYLTTCPDKIPTECASVDVSTEDGLRHCFADVVGFNKMRSFISSTFTVAQFYNLTYSPKTIFPQVDLSAKFNDSRCSITSLFASNRICYTIQCSYGSPLTITRYTLTEGDLKGAMIVITVNQSIVRDWEFTFVYVHEPFTFPYGYESSWVGLTFNRLPSLYLIKYKLIKVDLLPKPYVTACRDYESIGFDNRLDYFDHCINQSSLEYFGLPSHRTFMYPTLNISFPSHQLNRQSAAYRVIENNCIAEISQPQCHYTFYIASNEGWYPTDDNTSKILLLAPNEPDLHAITLPAHGFYQFLIFVETILGIWFGFNYFGYGQKIFSSLYEYSKIEPKLRWQQIKKQMLLGKLGSKSKQEKPNFNRKRSSKVQVIKVGQP
ncbi:uncharacterized protein LOC107363173 isoform X2 [Tetranychus urticae]|uniref:Uncharacterized protein n=1 Tax=Tetranychus urticae TaxID=32264 RepID=T1KEA7_TETUR|nr:uncharacterized protein LOC107363173 isoform X2 [Tetranychus urticae]